MPGPGNTILSVARHYGFMGSTTQVRIVEEHELPQDKSSALVFYCSNFMCRKAPNAARRAERMGYTNVQVMSAGISGWLSAGLPTEPD